MNVCEHDFHGQRRHTENNERDVKENKSLWWGNSGKRKASKTLFVFESQGVQRMSEPLSYDTKAMSQNKREVIKRDLF